VELLQERLAEVLVITAQEHPAMEPADDVWTGAATFQGAMRA
jgi:hypothetical protein